MQMLLHLLDMLTADWKLKGKDGVPQSIKDSSKKSREHLQINFVLIVLLSVFSRLSCSEPSFYNFISCVNLF